VLVLALPQQGLSMYYGAAYPEGLFACSLAVTYQHEHPLVCERPLRS
jgi:hypothetical protein